MAHPNEDLVRQGYKAFGEGDMETLRSLFAPDAVHSATGNGPLAGDYKVVAIHHDSGQRGGKTLDQDETLTFTISGGKFTHLVEDHSDQAAYDAFWS